MGKDPWKQKASNLAYKCRAKGGGAVVWMDGFPGDDPSRVRAVEAKEAPDDSSLVGVYGPEVGGPEIEADLLDDLAKALPSSEEGNAPQPAADSEDPGFGLPPEAMPQPEGGDEAREEEVATGAGDPPPESVPDPEVRYEPEPAEGADPGPLPGPPSAGPVAASETDPAGEGCPSAAQAPEGAGDGVRWTETDVLGVKAELYEAFAQAHRNGRPGRRDVYDELIRRLDTLEWQAQKKPAGAMG
jgi:hypothetical protein